ncbi:MAG: putative maltokinase, partial [Casimicrobiaceae bacterium]
LRALLARRVRTQLEREVLPVILANQRWFAGKGHAIDRALLRQQDEWNTPAGSWLLASVQVELDDGSKQNYSLPMAFAWEEAQGERLQSLLHCTVARVRQRARVGVLYDAFWDDGFCRAVVDAMARGETRAARVGELCFWATPQLAGAGPRDNLAIDHPSYEQSNTLVVLGEKLVLKGYRRLRPGVNPEIEIGRFLTEVSPFPYIAALYGALEYRNTDGETTALAVLQQYVPNEGNGWDYTVGYLRRMLDDIVARPVTQDVAAMPVPVPDPSASGLLPADDAGSLRAGFLALIGTLGRRTAELHVALSHTTGDGAFDPEPFTTADIDALRARLANEAKQTMELLAARVDSLPESVRADAVRLVANADRLVSKALAAIPNAIDAMKTRYHGDFHLGQVLLNQHEFYIVDFEGEPSRPLAERRAKHCALRDVAGMLRSFAYAAAFALQHATAAGAIERARLAESLAQWRAQTTATFLDGYREVAGGARSWPADATVARQLVDTFVFEKALYELRYELANRPDWVGIPLAALLERLQDTVE